MGAPDTCSKCKRMADYEGGKAPNVQPLCDDCLPSPSAELAQARKERDVFERAAVQLQRQLEVMHLRAQSAEAAAGLESLPDLVASIASQQASANRLKCDQCDSLLEFEFDDAGEYRVPNCDVCMTAHFEEGVEEGKLRARPATVQECSLCDDGPCEFQRVIECIEAHKESVRCLKARPPAPPQGKVWVSVLGPDENESARVGFTELDALGDAPPRSQRLYAPLPIYGTPTPDPPVPHRCDECKEPFFTSGQVLCAEHRRDAQPAPGGVWVQAHDHRSLLVQYGEPAADQWPPPPDTGWRRHPVHGTPAQDGEPSRENLKTSLAKAYRVLLDAGEQLGASDKALSVANEKIAELKKELRLFMPELGDALLHHFRLDQPVHKIALAIRVLKERAEEIGTLRTERDAAQADKQIARDMLIRATLVEADTLCGAASDAVDFIAAARVKVGEMHAEANAPAQDSGECSGCTGADLVFEAAGWECVECDTLPRVNPLSRTIYCDTPCEGEAAYNPIDWIAKQKAAQSPPSASLAGEPPRCEHPGDCGECNACVENSSIRVAQGSGDLDALAQAVSSAKYWKAEAEKLRGAPDNTPGDRGACRVCGTLTASKCTNAKGHQFGVAWICPEHDSGDGACFACHNYGFRTDGSQ